MNSIYEIVDDIRKKLRYNAPILTEEQRIRMYKILNSENPNFMGYGTKISDIDEIKKNRYIINVALYVLPELSKERQKENKSLAEVVSEWRLSSENVSKSFKGNEGDLIYFDASHPHPPVSLVILLLQP